MVDVHSDKKRSRRERWQNQKGIVHVCALFSGSLITLGLGLCLAHLKPHISPPAYEEASGIESDLKRAITQIDSALYDTLFQGGKAAMGVVSIEVEPESKQGQGWDFTELLIKVSDRHSAFRVEECIDAQLKPLTPQVTSKSTEVKGREIVCYVFALGMNTHRIRLIYEGPEETFYEDLPRIALIIDDLGYDRDMAIAFFQLDMPLTFSVLPMAPYSDFIVQEANKRGRELMLHLPLEPKNYPSSNPGPGALLADMDDKEIKNTLEADLRQIAGSRGVNNHMGSYFTERTDKMQIVLRELKKRHLFYIDSRTTKETVALQMARKMGLPSARRHVFLDNELSPRRIRFQMERLLGMAKRSGNAIGIAHPHEETLQVIKEYRHRLKTNVKVIPASELVGASGDQRWVKVK